jgi:hypothetical protein
MTIYLEQRPILKAANSGLKSKEIGKIISANWKNLPDEDKLQYKDATHPHAEQVAPVMDEVIAVTLDDLEKLLPQDRPVDYMDSESENDGCDDSDSSDSEDED